MANSLQRRTFLIAAGIAAGKLSAGAVIAGDQTATPKMTTGPFYPVPEIAKQTYWDADLTRLNEDSPVAEGEIIVVQGQVCSIDGEPLRGSLVEVWQANAFGRYNHAGDSNTAELDPNFQYWCQIETDQEGRYSFKTIKPGKYPGRTPHIHMCVRNAKMGPPGESDLITQLFFEEHMDANRKDGLYQRLNKGEQAITTVAFEKSDAADGLPLGQFDLFMTNSKRAANRSKATPRID